MGSQSSSDQPCSGSIYTPPYKSCLRFYIIVGASWDLFVMPSPKKTGINMPLDVSPELAKIIGTTKGEQVSRPQVVKKLWAYLKEKNLQDPENKQWFTPDKTMQPVFGKEKIKAFGMTKFLKEHLTNPNN